MPRISFKKRAGYSWLSLMLVFQFSPTNSISVSRKSLISSLLVGGLLSSLIGASPANAAPAIALSINGVAITSASVSTTPASVTVPADNSVDAVDAVRFFLTGVDAGTTVTVAATNSFIVSSLSTTLNPVKSNTGVISANFNVGTGTASQFFAYTRSTGLGTITITNGGSTFTYYIRGTAGPAYTVAYTPDAKPFTSTLVKQSVKITDVFGNAVAGVTPTLSLINLTSTTPTSSNANGVSEFTLTFPFTAGKSALSVSIPAVDVVGFDPSVKAISTSFNVTDGKSDAEVGVGKNIRIAFQGPLSGPEAATGNEQLDGVKYAVAQFNKRFYGKLNVSVTLIDDQGDPAVAQKIAPSIAAMPTILGIVGPSYSGAAIASIPFYKAQNLAMISPSATRVSMTDPAQGAIGFPVFHRIPSLEKVEGPSLYKIATEGVSTPKVVIVNDGSSYGVTLMQNIFDGKPSGVVGTIKYGEGFVANGGSNFSDAVDFVKKQAPNVVIYVGYSQGAAALYTQLRTSGYKGILAGGEGVNSSIFDYATSSVLEGVRLSAGTVPLSEINSDLESNFRLFGKASGAYAAESIDATNVLLYCIATGVTTRNQMLTCIDGFKGTSVFGHTFGFDANGDNIKQVFYGFEIKSGAIKLNQALGRTKQSIGEIITSFPWYNVLPVAESTNVTQVQLNSYTDRSNKLIDAINTHLELLDALNAAIQDALDAESFSPLPAFTAQLGALESKLLAYSQSLDELNAIEDLDCSIVNSDTTNSEESIILQDICAEFADALAAASDAFNAAEFSTDDVRGWLSFMQAEKTAADLKLKQEADAKAAAALKAKQEADAKAAADLKAKQEADAKAAAALKTKQEADAKAAADLKAKQEADARAAAALKAKQEADAKAAADLKAKQEADAKAAAALRAQLEADAKAAAALRAQLEADAKATADLRAKQEADAKAAVEKAAADLRAKQEADTKAAAAKAAADKAAADKAAAAKAAAAKAAAAKAKKSPKVTCKKGSIVKVFVGKQCPPGYKK